MGSKLNILPPVFASNFTLLCPGGGSGLKSPEPPPGHRRVRFEAKTGGKIFNLLLNFSTQLFKQVTKFGKNLSSMTSEVTILAKDDEVDIRRAALHGVKIKEANSKILLQTHAIADTGADTNCTDQTLRKILGRDKLPDAHLGLKGVTGKNENKSKDKLRIITKDKEINVIEARSIEELGYTGPNSTQFNSFFVNCFFYAFFIHVFFD